MTDDQVNALLDRLDAIATFLKQTIDVAAMSMQPPSQSQVISQVSNQPLDEFTLLSQKVLIEQWKQQFGEDKINAWILEGKASLGV